MAPKLESVTGTELINPPWARRTAQLDSLLTQCSLPTGPHSHGGEKRSRRRQHILACSSDLPKGIPTEAGKDAENHAQGKEGPGCTPRGSGRGPQPGQPGCRQPKPAVSDPPLVAIKHSKVHEPATEAAFSESKAGSECWDTGSRVSCPHTRQR